MKEGTARNTEKTRKRDEKQIMKSRKKDKSILADFQKAVVIDIIDNVTSDLGFSCKSTVDSIQNGVLQIPFATKHEKEKRKRKRSSNTNDRAKTKKKKRETDVSRATASVDDDSSSAMFMPESAFLGIYTLPFSSELEVSSKGATSFPVSNGLFSKSDCVNPHSRFSMTGFQYDHTSQTSFSESNNLNKNSQFGTNCNRPLASLDVAKQSATLRSKRSDGEVCPIPVCEKSSSSDINRNPPSVDKESSATAFRKVQTELQYFDITFDFEMTGSSHANSSSFHGHNNESIHTDCESTVNTTRLDVNKKVSKLTNATTTSSEVTEFLTCSVKNMTTEALKDRNLLPEIILPDVFQFLDGRQREQLEYVADTNKKHKLAQEDISTTASKADNKKRSSFVEVRSDIEGMTENTVEESITSMDQTEDVEHQSFTNIQRDAEENKILFTSTESQTVMYKNCKFHSSTLLADSNQQMGDVSAVLKERSSSVVSRCSSDRNSEDHKEHTTGMSVILCSDIDGLSEKTMSKDELEVTENQLLVRTRSRTNENYQAHCSMLQNQLHPCMREVHVTLEEIPKSLLFPCAGDCKLPQKVNETSRSSITSRVAINLNDVVVENDKKSCMVKAKNVYKEISVRSFKNFSQIILTKAKRPKSFPSVNEKRMEALCRDHNFLDVSTLKELTKAFSNLQADDTCRAVLLSSVSSVFCSGINPLRLLQFKNGNPGKKNVLYFVKKFLDVLINFEKPIVAAVSAPAVGFGASILLFCDVVYASESASFQWAHLKQGLVPFGCVSQLLPMIVGRANAKSFLLGQRTITASEAKSVGLVSEVFPQDSLMKHVFPFCQELSSSLLSVLCMTKKLLNANQKRECRKAMEKERTLLMECLSLKQNQEKLDLYINYLVEG